MTTGVELCWVRRRCRLDRGVWQRHTHDAVQPANSLKIWKIHPTRQIHLKAKFRAQTDTHTLLAGTRRRGHVDEKDTDLCRKRTDLPDLRPSSKSLNPCLSKPVYHRRELIKLVECRR